VPRSSERGWRVSWPSAAGDCAPNCDPRAPRFARSCRLILSEHERMAEPSLLKIERDVQADVVRLSPVGELDLATVPQLEQEVMTMLSRDLRDVVIDLSGLTFIDSSALRLFLMLNQRAADDGWRLGLVNPSEQVRSVLSITGAEQSLPLRDENGT